MSDRTLTISWDKPNLDLGPVARMAGLDYMCALRDGTVQAPITKLIGFRMVAVEEGSAVFECVPGEQHYNPIGSVHGGLACTLLDSAMGCAVHSTLRAGMAYTTMELKVSLMRPIAANTGLLRCEGRVLHAGRRGAVAEGKLCDASGKLYAHGTSTCMLFPFDPERSDVNPRRTQG